VPEAFGLYVIEAMAATVPIVLPNHGSFPELIEKTEGGVLYDHAEKDSLCKVLTARLDDDEATQRLGKKGRVAVRQNYSNEKLANQFAENILAPLVLTQ
jgi:glycosyltransferase involved in cell wall biosynthesis